MQVDEEADDYVRIKTARTILKEIFGKSFHGALSLTPGHAPHIYASFSNSSKYLHEHIGAEYQWLERMAYVRPALRTFNDAILIHDCSGKGSGGLNLHVGQWTEKSITPWIALSPPNRDNAARLSFIGAFPAGYDVKEMEDKTSVCGLLIDEVLDRIPAKTVDTGIAMHFDAPNTEAPQTLLLAVPPRDDTWDYDLMSNTIRTAFQLAKIRTVDGEIMANFNQVLPAIFAGSALSVGTQQGSGGYDE